MSSVSLGLRFYLIRHLSLCKMPLTVGLQSPRNVILKHIPQNFKSYKINGRPNEVSVLVIDSIVANHCATKLVDCLQKPRMVRWSSVDSYSFKDLQMKVFNDGVVKFSCFSHFYFIFISSLLFASFVTVVPFFYP